MKIHDFDPDNRPRERFLAHGPSALSSAELLALILRTGTKNCNILDTCNQLIRRFSLEKLPNTSIHELMEINGIGPSKAMQISAIFELNKRLHHMQNRNKKIQCAQDVYEYMEGKIPDETREHLFILHLNTKNQVIKDEIVSVGTLNAALIHPREVFKSAIRESDHAIILVHNHPSGDPHPSIADKQVTELLKKTSNVIQIELLDHVIVSKTDWFSFKDHGLI